MLQLISSGSNQLFYAAALLVRHATLLFSHPGFRPAMAELLTTFITKDFLGIIKAIEFKLI